MLALSWSPTYCASPAGANDNSQCAPGRRFAFVVHGLWPQYDKGWPQDCPTVAIVRDDPELAAEAARLRREHATQSA